MLLHGSGALQALRWIWRSAGLGLQPHGKFGVAYSGESGIF